MRETEINLSPELFSQIFFNSSIGMVVYDESGECLEVNDRAALLIGASREKVLEQNFYQIESWKTSGLLDGAVKTLNTGDTVDVNIDLISSYGKSFVASVHFSRVDLSENRKGIFLTIQDFTEQAELEKELKQNRDFNTSILNISPDNLYIYDIVNNSNIYTNSRINDTLGYCEQDVQAMGKKLISTLMHPDDYEEYIAKTIPRYLCAKDDEVIEHKYRMKHKNGSWRWLLSRELIFLRTPDGTPTQIFGMISDITQRVKSEIAVKESHLKLEQSEEKYRKLFENMPDAFAMHRLIVDDSGKPVDYIFLEVNSAFEKLTGLKKDDIIGKKVTEAIPGIENDNADWINQYFKVAQNSNSIHFEQFAAALNKWFSITAYSPSKMEFVTVFQDITEQKQIDANRLQAQKMESIGQLAGGIAHDFNNQLAGIVGYADLLCKSLPRDSELKRFADGIILSSKRASDLTSQLLAFARKGKFREENIDVHNIIMEVAAILERTIDKRIKINTNLSAESSVIMGDPTQIQNVFMNVALNARDAMPGGGELKFETSSLNIDKSYSDNMPSGLKPGSYIEISIIDNGCGMDEGVKNKIFEPFFTTKQPGKGTGMGLASAYGAINNHGGIINVQSIKDTGTTVQILIPCEKVVQAVDVNESLELNPENSPKKILLVDDEEIILDIAKTILENLSHEVFSFSNGNDAIEYYKNNFKNIDVVILDMVMPEISGKETFFEMKKINPDIVSLLISGYSLNGKAQDILDAGVKGFLQKPYRISELSNKLREILLDN
ncbi:MAG: PAS domain S-box protein [Deltaproteobacteria bacterium]|nr:PAS domain S-box protein [Deltaproteobacteria bacterium]